MYFRASGGFLHIHCLRHVWHRLLLRAEEFATRPLWIPRRPRRATAKSPRRGRRKRSVPIKRSPALLLPGQREPWRRLWLGSDCGRSSWFEFSSARLRRTWRRQGTGSGEVGGARAPGACARTLDPPPEFQGAPERLSLPRAARPFVPAPGSRVPWRAHAAALPPQDLSPGGEQRKSPCHEPQLFGDRRREARRLRALRGRGVRWVWLGRGRATAAAGRSPSSADLGVPDSLACIFPRRWVSADYAGRPPHRSGNVHCLGLPHPRQERSGGRGSIGLQRRQARPSYWYPALTLLKSPNNRRLAWN